MRNPDCDTDGGRCAPSERVIAEVAAARTLLASGRSESDDAIDAAAARLLEAVKSDPAAVAAAVRARVRS